MVNGVQKQTGNIMKNGNGKFNNESMGIKTEPYFFILTG